MTAIVRALSAVALALMVGMVGGLWPAAAAAADFRSVGVAAATLYDGPSAKGKKLYVGPRDMPLEVLSIVGPWVKVRDFSSEVMWAQLKDLSSERTVIAVAPASVRNSAQDSAAVAFNVDRGVTLLLQPSPPGLASGWVRVRHRDGGVGYMRASDLWGV